MMRINGDRSVTCLTCADRPVFAELEALRSHLDGVHGSVLDRLDGVPRL